MAEVFLAAVAGPAGFSKLHVIKVMKPELLEESENRAMFLDEGKLAARLNHPNIVQTYEVQIEGEQYFMAMEYLDGQPLHRILRRSAKVGNPLPLHWHIHVLCEVLAALEHAHELRDYDGTPLKVVHRDVTPHNVFVTYAGQVKLCDFGIAKTMTSSVETRAGILKGKVSYMAPEQVLGSRLDHRADLFSVGVMLWEAATGERIWAGQSELHIMQSLCDGIIPRVGESNPSVDPELRQIIDRGLAADPKQRWQTAGEFRRALENWVFSNTARVDPRAIGEWISNQFSKERTKLQGVIQEQMNDRHGPPEAFDSLLPPRMGSTGESSRSQRAPSSGAEPASSGPPQRGSLTIPSVEVRAMRPRRTIAAAVGVAAALAIFLVIGVTALVVRSAQPEPEPGVEGDPRHPTVEPVQPPTPSPTPTPSTRVRIRVKVNPQTAKLTLDGTPVDNPLVIEQAKDERDHSLHAEAPGYESETRILRFEQNLQLDFGLEKATAASKKSSAAGTAPDKDKDKDQPELGSVKKKPPSTELDKDDPWK
jgi:eukaryotic-like serine/threonine-protein kinase